MAYEKYYPGGWQSGPNGGTPITPEALEHMESGIENALPKDETAASAEKLATARGIRVNLGSEAKASFDGSEDATPGVTGVLPLSHGGTSATDAATARDKLQVPKKADGVVQLANLEGIGTSANAGQWWKFWNWGDGNGNYPTAFLPTENGTQNLGLNDYKIKEVYANNYPCGTWNGNAISVAKGGTGATDAENARRNLGITPDNIGAIPASGGNVSGWLNFVKGTYGFSWITDNGTKFELRPYSPDNVWQLVRTTPGGAVVGDITVRPDGRVALSVPLPIGSGGTGAANAATALSNLGGMPLTDKNMTLLWENATPTSAFAGNTNISFTDAGYDAVFFVYRVKTDREWIMTRVLPIGYASFIEAFVTNNATRRVTVWNGQITVYDASVATTYGNPVTDNSYLIPYKIYGVKWVH